MIHGCTLNIHSFLQIGLVNAHAFGNGYSYQQIQKTSFNLDIFLSNHVVLIYRLWRTHILVFNGSSTVKGLGLLSIPVSPCIQKLIACARYSSCVMVLLEVVGSISEDLLEERRCVQTRVGRVHEDSVFQDDCHSMIWEPVWDCFSKALPAHELLEDLGPRVGLVTFFGLRCFW